MKSRRVRESPRGGRRRGRDADRGRTKTHGASRRRRGHASGSSAAPLLLRKTYDTHPPASHYFAGTFGQLPRPPPLEFCAQTIGPCGGGGRSGLGRGEERSGGDEAGATKVVRGDGAASTARSHSPVGSRVDAQGSNHRRIRLGVVDGKKGSLRGKGGSLSLLGEEPRRFGVTVEDGRDEANHVRDIGRGVNGTAEMDNS